MIDNILLITFGVLAGMAIGVAMAAWAYDCDEENCIWNGCHDS